MRTIRVTIERSWTRQRVWLKAVDSNGTVEIVQNIPAMDAVEMRNELLERLTASGVYDEVTGDAIKAFPDPASQPWNIKAATTASGNPKWKRRAALYKERKGNEDTNDPSERKRRQRSPGKLSDGNQQTPRGD